MFLLNEKISAVVVTVKCLTYNGIKGNRLKQNTTDFFINRWTKRNSRQTLVNFARSAWKLQANDISKAKDKERMSILTHPFLSFVLACFKNTVQFYVLLSIIRKIITFCNVDTACSITSRITCTSHDDGE